MSILLLCIALQATPPASSDSEDPHSYIVGPSDVLEITVYQRPQLSGRYTVDIDGTFPFPLIGRMQAGGYTLRAVEDNLRDRLAQGYLRDPQISVTMNQYRSQQVFLLGEVQRPGELEFTGAMTLIEALARAGSTTPEAGSEVLIVRSRSGWSPSDGPVADRGETENSEVIRVDLDSLETGSLSQNVALRAGDTIFVTRAGTVFVTGNVRSPGMYSVRPDTTVRQVLALAGGVSDRGSTRRIHIIKRIDGEEVRGDASLEDLVQAGDTIEVRERFF